MLKIGWACIGLSSHIFLARVMGKSNYGDYAYVISWLSIFSLISILGFDSTILRYISIYYAKESWANFRGLLRYSHLVVVITSLSVSLICILIIWNFREGIHFELYETLLIATATVPFMTIAILRQSVIQAMKFVVQAQFGLMILRTILIVLFTFLMWSTSTSILTAPQTMYANLLATIVVLYFNSVVFKRRMPKYVKSSKDISYEKSNWMKMALPLLLMSSMLIILRKTDIIIIGIIVDSAHVGIYNATTLLVEILIFGLIAVNPILAPIVAELYSQDMNYELQNLMTIVAWGNFGFSMILSIALLIFGKTLLGLFGSDFHEGYSALVILLIGQLINSLSGSVGVLLTMSQYQVKAAFVICNVAVLNLILNYILVPLFGISGAAIATTISTIAWNLVMLFLVVKLLGINPTIFSLLKFTKNE
jgi:O-antigen/teichoic acid export membrane protein